MGGGNGSDTKPFASTLRSSSSNGQNRPSSRGRTSDSSIGRKPKGGLKANAPKDSIIEEEEDEHNNANNNNNPVAKHNFNSNNGTNGSGHKNH